VPLTDGATLFAGGAGGSTTTAVAADDAAAEPCEFVAVSRKTIVEPSSAFVSVYVVPVAPPMEEQLLPDASQRSQAYVEVEAGYAVNVPAVPVSTSPTCVVPEIVGGAVFTGAASGGVIVEVCAEVADAFANALVPVTTTRMVCPLSPVTTVYVDEVALPMSAQFAPVPSHCCH
jgi:hypothetical protein